MNVGCCHERYGKGRATQREKVKEGAENGWHNTHARALLTRPSSTFAPHKHGEGAAALHGPRPVAAVSACCLSSTIPFDTPTPKCRQSGSMMTQWSQRASA